MSPIYLLSDKVYEGAKNLPTIMIAFLEKKVVLEGVEALVFTSKNAVLAIERLDTRWKTFPCYAIGVGTAKMIESLGGEVVYQAKSSYGDDFAQEIKSALAAKVVLFLRAKEVTSALNTILKEAGVLLRETIVYETRCEACAALNKPEKNAIMIFSSPSTIECFFRCFDWDESYQAVVIGEKTASFMPQGIAFDMAAKPSITSCIEVATKLSKKSL